MDAYKKAIEKIKKDEKCKPSCSFYIGPTGPTHTLKSESK